MRTILHSFETSGHVNRRVWLLAVCVAIISATGHLWMASAHAASAHDAADILSEAATEPAISPETVGDITYITGGVGREERHIIEDSKKEYNLHIMSANTLGEFAGMTTLILRDAKGQELLQAEAGPLFYLKLAPGRYEVEMVNEEVVRKSSVNVPKKGAAHLHFGWK